MRFEYMATQAGISVQNRTLLAALHQKVSSPFEVTRAAEVLGLSAPRARRFLAYLADRGGSLGSAPVSIPLFRWMPHNPAIGVSIPGLSPCPHSPPATSVVGAPANIGL